MERYKALIGVGVLGMASLVGFRLLGKHDKDEPVKQPSEVNNTSYTEFTRYTHYNRGDGVADVIVYRIDSPPNIKIMSDGGKHGVNDGLVDMIAILDPELCLNRRQDYEKHKEEFDRADKLLAEVKRRAEKSGYPSEKNKGE